MNSANIPIFYFSPFCAMPSSSSRRILLIAFHICIINLPKKKRKKFKIILVPKFAKLQP